tara:strand:+ start:10201 stop:10539 length:339 start_codon:yes stop_codon:yes gene_type:complete
MKGKPLLPSLKQKKRYVVFEVISKDKLKYNDIKKEIDSVLISFLGELGYAKAGIMFINQKHKFPYGMIKVNHKFVNELKAGLTLVKKVDGKKVIVKSVVTSGTIKKLSSYFK